MDTIPVVHEVLDVFPQYLLGVPHDRDIDFSIDSNPCTKPLFISPYRITLVEYKSQRISYNTC